MRGTGIPPRLRAAWTTNFLLTTATAGLLSLAAGVASAQTAATPSGETTARRARPPHRH